MAKIFIPRENEMIYRISDRKYFNPNLVAQKRYEYFNVLIHSDQARWHRNITPLSNISCHLNELNFCLFISIVVLSTRERKKEICPHIKVARNTVLLCLLLHKMLVFCPFKRLINSSKKQSHLLQRNCVHMHLLNQCLWKLDTMSLFLNLVLAK